MLYKANITKCAYFVLLISIAIFADAQSEDLWEKMNGPYTGSFKKFLFLENGRILATPNWKSDDERIWVDAFPEDCYDIAKNSQGHIYAGELYRLWKSVDDGSTWLTLPSGSLNIHSIDLDSYDNVYYCDGRGGIKKSTDGGETWNQVFSDSSVHIKDIVIQQNNIIWAHSDNKVYKSTNLGGSWNEIRYIDYENLNVCFLSAPLPGVLFVGLEYNHQTYGKIKRTLDGIYWETVLDSITFYDMKYHDDDNLYAGSKEKGLFISPDTGATWIQYALPSNTINCLEFTATGALYLGTAYGGAYKSENNDNLFESIGGECTEIYDIVRADNGDFLAVGGRLYRSIDNGQNWIPEKFMIAGLSQIAKSNAGVIYATGHMMRVYRSFDDGHTWTAHAPGAQMSEVLEIIPDGETVYMGGENSVSISHDSLETYQSYPITLRTFDIAITPTGRALAAGFWDLYEYDPITDVWSVVNSPYEIPISVAINSKQEVFLGLASIGVYKSQLGDYAWERLFSVYQPIYELDMNDKEYIFASSYWYQDYGGIYTSFDDGLSWLDISSNIQAEEAGQFFCEDSNTVIVTVLNSYPNNGLYRNRLPINNFIEVWPGDMDNNGIVEPEDIIPLVEHWYEEVPKRAKIDYEWRCHKLMQWDESMPLQIDANGSSRIDIFDFAAICLNAYKTHGEVITNDKKSYDFNPNSHRQALNEIYENVKDSGSGIEHEIRLLIENLLDNSLPKSYSLTQNYPNPFNANTIINYSVPEDSDVEISIYNILGQKIKTLIFTYHNAGEYQCRWDGKDNAGEPVSSGLYFYKLKSDGTMISNSMTLLR